MVALAFNVVSQDNRTQSFQNILGKTNENTIHVMCCAIWYHLNNIKNVTNTHGGVLLLLKLQAKSATLLKVALLHGDFSRFLICTNGTKSRKVFHRKENFESRLKGNPQIFSWFISTYNERFFQSKRKVYNFRNFQAIYPKNKNK